LIVKHRILLFAGAREAANRDWIELDLPAACPASHVLEALAAQLPEAEPLVRVSRVAVDGEYVAGDHVIDREDVELALIPPVSGG
jgi:molybdopterin converting factor small subunit